MNVLLNLILIYQAFELLHGWTGLLVEANPAIFPVGFLSGRKAWHVCLIIIMLITIAIVIVITNTIAIVITITIAIVIIDTIAKGHRLFPLLSVSCIVS